MEKRQKTASIINILTIFLGTVGLLIRPDRYGIPPLAFYTILSNLIAMFSSVLFLTVAVFKIKIPFLNELRFCACCTLTVTFLVVTLCLVWFTDPLIVLFDRNNLFHHILIPIMTFCSYVYLEPHAEKKSAIVYPMVFTVVYSAVMIYLNATGKVDGPYPFFMTQRFGLIPVILFCIGIGALVYLVFSLIFRLAIRIQTKNRNLE